MTLRVQMSLFVGLAGCGTSSVGALAIEASERPAAALRPREVGPVGDSGRPAERCAMNGGGWVRTPAGVWVSEGHSLQSPLAEGPARLRISWGRGHRFTLERLETGLCVDDPGIEPTPEAVHDTYVGTGVGRLDQGEGSVFFTFTDGGPGPADDSADIVIYDADGQVVLDVSQDLAGGDHRSL